MKKLGEKELLELEKAFTLVGDTLSNEDQYFAFKNYLEDKKQAEIIEELIDEDIPMNDSIDIIELRHFILNSVIPSFTDSIVGVFEDHSYKKDILIEIESLLLNVIMSVTNLNLLIYPDDDDFDINCIDDFERCGGFGSLLMEVLNFIEFAFNKLDILCGLDNEFSECDICDDDEDIDMNNSFIDSMLDTFYEILEGADCLEIVEEGNNVIDIRDYLNESSPYFAEINDNSNGCCCNCCNKNKLH